MIPAESFLQDLLKATVALFVIVDPIGLIPVFVGLTKDISSQTREKTFRVTTYTGSGLLIAFALVGQQILLLFRISLHSFMIAGGILLLLSSIEILLRGKWAEKITSEEVGVVPMAFPLLTGPGAITTTIVTLESTGIVVTLCSILIVMFVTWVIFEQIDWIYSLLGRIGSAVIQKVMAVFITAIAVQLMLTGIQFYYPPR